MALTEIRNIQKYDHYEKVVTAGRVANVFATSHEIIKEIIENMLEKKKHDVAVYTKLISMFSNSKYIDDEGNEQCEYYMTKDGFILVMMKLTGNKDLEKNNLFWVLEYINAFNILQEKIIKERYMNEYTIAHPDTRLHISQILHNASMQGAKKLEAALVYFADYIPDRLNEIYKPEVRKQR